MALSNLVCPEKWRLPQPRVLSPGSRGRPETSQSGAGLFRGRTCSRQVGASRAAVLLRRASITMARSPRGLAGGERQAARRWMQAQLGGQVSGRSAPAARAAGAPRVEALAFLPQGSKELWGALTAPLPAPPIAASGPGLCHLSLPTRPGRAPPLCRWGRLLPVAETDDIFISLSKPPLFMEVSPG